MIFTSQPADVSPDEAAARFTRATELLMRGAERRKAAQNMTPPPSVPPFPRMTANGRFVRRDVRPFQMGGA